MRRVSLFVIIIFAICFQLFSELDVKGQAVKLCKKYNSSYESHSVELDAPMQMEVSVTCQNNETYKLVYDKIFGQWKIEDF